MSRWIPTPQSAVAVWLQDPSGENVLPNLLVCSDEARDDWAAWITTFAARIRPFSAFTRLIGQSKLLTYAERTRQPTLQQLTWPVAGVVLGEVLAASRLPDRMLETLPANACESTLSFALFRAATLYSSFGEWPELVEDWEFARQVTRQPRRQIDSSLVARVCASVIQAAGWSGFEATPNVDKDVIQACQELIRSSGTESFTLSRSPQFQVAFDRMHGSREDRVVAFGEFIRSQSDRPKENQELTSLMLGFLLSRIAPGTIQHSAILAPLLPLYASALLWYGFAAGLDSAGVHTKQTGSLRSVLEFPPTARWIVRDLLRPDHVLSPPISDIAVSELRALSRTTDDPLHGLVRTSPQAATIEIAPGVWTVVSLSQRPTMEDPGRPRRERRALAAVGEHIDRLREAYEDLIEGEAMETGQQRLFDPKRKRP
jgi:hypothetical protein